jgi:hypothetical protein
VRWIEGAGRGADPFFLFVGFPGPHDPWDAPIDAVDAFGPADGDEGVRDCEGIIEQALIAAGARAVVLRPDRYVLAYLSEADCAGGMLALRELLKRHAAIARLE